MIPTLTNKLASDCAAAPMSAIPTAAGMERVTRELCPRLATDQGCPFGRRCQYAHPRECPGT
eukprot:9820255-Prorocentrum_lima.AAC.1